jgi:hypothetical protein
VAAQELVDLAARLVLGCEGELEVRPVEGMHHQMRRPRKELLGDVLARLPVGCRGQRRHRHAAQRLARLGEQPVFGPEIMTPLRDAMGFVDGQPRHAETTQPADQPFPRQPLGRDEEQAQLA